MTFLELVQRLRQECRVSGTGPVTVVGQSAEFNRLVTWTNEAWQEIQRGNSYWRFLRASCTCPTVQGQASYSATSFGLTDFGQWALNYDEGDTFRSYVNPEVTFTIAASTMSLAGHGLSNGDQVKVFTTGALPSGLTAGIGYYVVNAATDTVQLAATAGGAAITLSGTQSGTHTLTSNNTTTFIGMRTETPLWPMDYDNWRDTYQFGATRNTYSRPVTLALAPNDALVCGPVAASGYTLIGDYYKRPTALVADSDTPTMPVQFHMAIVYKAMTYYGASEAAPEVHDFGAQKYEQIFRQLVIHQAPRIQVAGALC